MYLCVCLVCWFWSVCLFFFNYFIIVFIIILFYFGTVSSLGRKGQVLVATKLLRCLYLLHLHDYARSQQLSCLLNSATEHLEILS